MKWIEFLWRAWMWARMLAVGGFATYIMLRIGWSPPVGCLGTLGGGLAGLLFRQDGWSSGRPLEVEDRVALMFAFTIAGALVAGLLEVLATVSKKGLDAGLNWMPIQPVRGTIIWAVLGCLAGITLGAKAVLDGRTAEVKWGEAALVFALACGLIGAMWGGALGALGSWWGRRLYADG